MPTNRIFQVDPTQTLLSAFCANEAYYPTRHNAPAGYKFHSSWEGRNPSILGGNVETYGLVFQGDTPSTSSEYIFAFKGTSSWWDVYEDIFVNQVPFVPYNPTGGSTNANVANGFMAVYSAPVTPGGSDSMQDQLFSLIETLKPSKVLITGHSLGSALAELFAFDLYVSIGVLPFELSQINFACPRVGDANFAQEYRQFESSIPKVSSTIRIVNYWDMIPCLPFENLGYEHGPDYFMCSFYKYEAWIPHYTVRHSMFNYWQVLIEVLKNNPQQYDGQVTGYQGITLQSTILSSSQTECSSQFAEEWMAQANKMGAKKPNKGCLSFFGLFG